MNVIMADNIPQAFSEAFWKMRVWAVEEESRHGPVMTCPVPVMLEVFNPAERVLFDPTRDANPFFHLMETAWMFAGRRDSEFLIEYNKNMASFSEETGDYHAAYGFRWRQHFGGDQICGVIGMLQEDPTTRRAVIAMWDPSEDCGAEKKDLPCNTHIYFRVVNEKLDMTVCNRSNDLVWGMLGANAVHMTYLHELVASGAGVPVGIYRVFTTNLHVYKSVPRFEQIWETRYSEDNYSREVRPFPLVGEYECYHDILADCKSFCLGHPVHTRWVSKVLLPAAKAWYVRKINPEACHTWIDEIAADDWRIACREWVIRRQNVRSE